ncbi:hypothetical protein Ancab_021393 [Ancistrocladus abbreviatus]
MTYKTHRGSFAIVNYGNMGSVLGCNDVYLSGINVYMTQDDGDINAHISGHITSNDEWLPNDEIRINYASDSNVDDDTYPTYVVSGVELKLIATPIGERIMLGFQELISKKLGQVEDRQ